MNPFDYVASKLGKSQLVAEPDPGAQVVRMGIGRVDDNMVPTMAQGVAYGDVQPVNDYPRARDWTIYASAEPQEVPRFFAPNADLLLSWGTGGVNFERRVPIAQAGTVQHVVANWVEATIELGATALPGDGDIRLKGTLSPGRPSETIASAYFEVSVTGLNPVIPVPAFVTSFAVQAFAGVVAVPNTVQTLYDTVTRGAYAFPVAGNAQPINGALSLLPNDCNGLRVGTPAGVTAFNIFWGMSS